MLNFIAWRFGRALLTVVAVLAAVFMGARLTGNPVEVMFPEGLTPEQEKALTEQYGLDKFLPEQFVVYLRELSRGNFGISHLEKRPVVEMFGEDVGATASLGACAFTLSMVIGVPLGIVAALRVSVGIAMIGVIFGSVIGVSLGVLSGVLRGWTGRIIMMVVDFQLSIPFLLIVLVGIAIFGTDIPVLLALVSVAYWETYARLSRGQVLSVRDSAFVEAAVAMGATHCRIALRHILPSIASPIIVLLTVNFPTVLLLESSLSFLGIGVQPPTASPGRMVGDGQDYMLSAWWLVISPAAFIVLVTLCVQLAGDWLRNVIDVKLD